MTDIYETISCCRICNSERIQEILNLGHQPPANSLYKNDIDMPSVVPLRLVYCQECSTVQLGEDVDPEYLFGKYLWVTGTSATAHDYSYIFAKKALSLLSRKSDQQFIVEIASNDGTFLRRFSESGCKVLGIDPARNIAELANKNGIPTKANFFTKDLAKKILSQQGSADIVFARNVIPHVKEIHSVLKGIETLLNAKSIGIIEVHDAGLIVEDFHYDYIYHEHLFYYTLKTISGLIERYGLHVFDVIRSPISGGSWVLYFSKSRKEKTTKLINYLKTEEEKNVNSYSKWIKFANKVKSHSEILKKMVLSGDKKILAYGASARSSTLLNFCEINNKHISLVVDKNPMKSGLITAGSNIPIVSFEDGLEDIKHADKILLLAWNFQDEIISELRKVGFSGEFIIPLPGMPYIL
jgi:hypothetical protein